MVSVVIQHLYQENGEAELLCLYFFFFTCHLIYNTKMTEVILVSID